MPYAGGISCLATEGKLNPSRFEPTNIQNRQYMSGCEENAYRASQKRNPQSKGSVFPGTVSEEGDRGQKRRDSRRKYFFCARVAGMLIAGEVLGSA